MTRRGNWLAVGSGTLGTYLFLISVVAVAGRGVTSSPRRLTSLQGPDLSPEPAYELFIAGEAVNPQIGSASIFSTVPFARIESATPAPSKKNDHFKDAMTVSESDFSHQFNAESYSVEEGEPNCLDGSDFGGSAWYRFEAEKNSYVNLSASGPLSRIAVSPYEGTALKNLKSRGCSSGPGGGSLFVPVDAGEVRYIQIAFPAGSKGLVTVNIDVEIIGIPDNDDFSSAQRVSNVDPRRWYAEDTRAASVQPGEITPSCGPIGATVWYRFQPRFTTIINASTGIHRPQTYGPGGVPRDYIYDGSNFDSVLALYEGNSFGSLQERACSHVPGKDSTEGQQSRIENFQTDGGRTYFLQIGGFMRDRGHLTFSFQGSDGGEPD